MTFSNDLDRFRAKLARQQRDVFVGVAAGVHESIQSGSAVTGAPGQPVDTGNLKISWQLTYPDAVTAEVATSAEYAPAIEDGIGPHGPLQLRSETGGFHSVKMTIAGFERLVESVVRKVTGNG